MLDFHLRLGPEKSRSGGQFPLSLGSTSSRSWDLSLGRKNKTGEGYEQWGGAGRSGRV